MAVALCLPFTLALFPAAGNDGFSSPTMTLELTDATVIGTTNKNYASYTIDASYNRGKHLH